MATARVWREQKQRYRNQAARCVQCGKTHYPPQGKCVKCGSHELEAHTMADTGRVLTYSVVHVAPPAFAAYVPYVVAVLEMDDGTRCTAQVVDIAPEEMKTGLRIRLEFRKIRQHGRSGIISYGHKAVPA